jgi:hypothetical protein
VCQQLQHVDVIKLQALEGLLQRVENMLQHRVLALKYCMEEGDESDSPCGSDLADTLLIHISYLVELRARCYPQSFPHSFSDGAVHLYDGISPRPAHEC